TLLANMAPLQVARKHDRHRPRKNSEFMNMTQCPVLITPGLQLRHRAGGIVRMLGVAFERGMQHADVEMPGQRIRVGRGEVVGDGGMWKALPMQRHLELRQYEGD